ncbi:hypothetical protein ACMATS_06415 [Streptoverticillium reticulum]|uniref:hypothetical protein n=1 Tax=Streptoverticillium reticulum TaxID=1433415 RepID=UPI0039BEFA05
MLTVPRNATTKIKQIRERYTAATMRSGHNDFESFPVPADNAWDSLYANPRARLVQWGDHYRITIHGAHWYELRKPTAAETLNEKTENQ